MDSISKKKESKGNSRIEKYVSTQMKGLNSKLDNRKKYYCARKMRSIEK